MPIASPPSFRSRVEDHGGLLRIIIPTRKAWFLIAFMGFWIIGWALGELWIGYGLIDLLFSGAAKLVAERGPGALLLYAWFGGWTISGVLMIYGLFWFLAGKEIIEIDEQSLRVRRRVLGIGRSRKYPAGRVERLRISPLRDSRIAPGVWAAGGPITFDYDGKTVRFGSGVDEVEANQLVKLILEHFPGYRAD